MQGAVENLPYITTVSRPDKQNAVGFLGRKISEPTKENWTTIKSQAAA